MAGGLYSMSAKDFDQTLDLTKVKPYGKDKKMITIIHKNIIKVLSFLQRLV